MWPFKCKLSACTFTWCCLFFRVWENEIVTFGWNFLLDKFGSEKVERSLSPNNLPLSKGTSYYQRRFSPGFAVPSEFAFITESGMKSLFTGIDSSSHTAVSPAQVIIFLNLFLYFIVIANIHFFQIDRLEPSVTDCVFRFRFHDSVSGFHVLVLPSNNCECNATRHEGDDKNWTLNQNKC